MDLIVASADGTVSSMEALHVAPDLEKKMAITHAEKLIVKLVKDNWMSEVSVSNIFYSFFMNDSVQFIYFLHLY